MLLNRERALGMMKEAHLDVLVGTTPENVTYMTNHTGWEHRAYRGNTMARGMQNYSVLTSEGERILIAHMLNEIPYAVSFGVHKQLDDVWAWGGSFINKPPGFKPEHEEERAVAEFLDSPKRMTEDAVTALINCLKEKGISKGRIGIELFGLAPAAEERLQSEFHQIEFVDCGELLCQIRYVKTPEEIELLKRAALVNEKALQDVLKAIKPGVTELEVRRVYKASIGAQDASEDFFNCSGGYRAGFWAGVSDYRYKRGDQIMVDPGCELAFPHRYHGDTGVICVLGEPTREHLEMWKKNLDVYNTLLDNLRPGMKPTEIFDRVAAVQKKHFGFVAGYFGHGIGIEKREKPMINRVPGAGQRTLDIGDDPAIEKGMVLCPEIPFTRMGFGAVHVEETVVITDHGYEKLLPTVRDLFTL